MADADTVAEAEACRGVGETCGGDGVQAVADGVVEKGEVGVELAGGDQGDEGLDGVWGQARMVVGCGVSRAGAAGRGLARLGAATAGAAHGPDVARRRS